MLVAAGDSGTQGTNSGRSAVVAFSLLLLSAWRKLQDLPVALVGRHVHHAVRSLTHVSDALSPPGEEPLLAGHALAFESEPDQAANLLNNAAKDTPDGGRIALSVERKDGRVRAAITDSGIGLSPDMLEAVFELFVRVRDAEMTSEGLGIGLSLARQLVEMHGGHISATSAGPMQGSTFVVDLPVLPMDAAERRGAHASFRTV